MVMTDIKYPGDIGLANPKKAGMSTSDIMAGIKGVAIPEATPVSSIDKSSYQFTPPNIQPITAPQLDLTKLNIGAVTSQMTPLQSAQQQIAEQYRLSTEAGLKALERQFAPQAEQERERVAQRGLVGSGVENEMMRRLYSEQQQSYQQFMNEQAAAEAGAQVQDIQALRELQSQRESQALEVAYNAAVKRGDWQQAAQIENKQTQLDIKQLEIQNQEIMSRIDIANADIQFKNDAAAIDRAKAEIDKYAAMGQITQAEADSRKVDLLLMENGIKSAAQHGLQGDAYGSYMYDWLMSNGMEEEAAAYEAYKNYDWEKDVKQSGVDREGMVTDQFGNPRSSSGNLGGLGGIGLANKFFTYK